MTIHNKNKLLIVGTVVMCVICYRLAIQKTLEIRATHKHLSHKADMFKQGPKQLALLKQEEVYYDSILLKHQLIGNSIQNNLLKLINRYAESNHIQILNFSEPHRIVDKKMETNTYRFTLKGDYNSIIKLIYKIETDTKLGEVISLEFNKKKKIRSGIHSLEVEVLLRSFG